MRNLLISEHTNPGKGQFENSALISRFCQQLRFYRAFEPIQVVVGGLPLADELPREPFSGSFRG
jgi:hypothetical protein